MADVVSVLPFTTECVAYRTLQTHNTGSRQRNTRFIGYLSKLYLTLTKHLIYTIGTGRTCLQLT